MNRWASKNWRAKWHWNMIFALLKKSEYDFTDEWNSASSEIWFLWCAAMSSKGRRGQATCHGDQLIVPVTYCSEPEKYRAVYNILQKYVHNSCWLCVKHIHANRFRFQIRFIIKARNQNWQLGSFIISRYFLFVQTVSLSDGFNSSVLS